MKKRYLVIFILGIMTIGLCGDVAIPNIALLGKAPNDVPISILTGSKDGTQPNSIKIEVFKGIINSVRASYGTNELMENIVKSVSREIGCDGKLLGVGIYMWRDDVKHISAMVIWNNDERTVAVKNLGPQKTKSRQ